MYVPWIPLTEKIKLNIRLGMPTSAGHRVVMFPADVG